MRRRNRPSVDAIEAQVVHDETPIYTEAVHPTKETPGSEVLHIEEAAIQKSQQAAEEAEPTTEHTVVESAPESIMKAPTLVIQEAPDLVQAPAEQSDHDTTYSRTASQFSDLEPELQLEECPESPCMSPYHSILMASSLSASGGDSVPGSNSHTPEIEIKYEQYVF